MKFTAQQSFTHDRVPAVGVLVVNLGTPDAPDTPSLRKYLRQFLSDPRVIELPKIQWQPILNLFVLTTRPKQSAHAYRVVWTDEGSPLLLYTKRQAEGIEEILRREVGTPVHVEAGMTYGEPSVATGLRSLREKGCDRLVILPMYPQYSGTTVGSVYDTVARELTTWRVVPEHRFINTYHDEPGYIASLAASIREVWREREPEKLLFSFHGIPKRYFEGGDPYHCLCHKTARLVAEELGLDDDRWVVAFQSLFGKEEWIKPYTADTVAAMARSGVKSLDVICPGFAADCLETIEEIDVQNRELFEENGGEAFRYIPALNDRPDHVRFLADLVQRNLQGWARSPEQYDRQAAEREAREAKDRADRMAEAGVVADAGFGS
ncbi:MAG: ferrochelatase [Acidobacteriota bacterium]|jgi:ferrochelatase